MLTLTITLPDQPTMTARITLPHALGLAGNVAAQDGAGATRIRLIDADTTRVLAAVLADFFPDAPIEVA